MVGGSGLLGRELCRQAVLEGRTVAATFHRRPPAGADVDVDVTRLDVRDRDEVSALFRRVRPGLVVNAAYRMSDWATTAEGALHVALAATQVGARLVQVSSDAVFSGTQVHYDEAALPDPITPYGAAKAAAETAVKGVAPTAVIARTSLIIGRGDSPQETFVHALASGTVSGALFTDEVRCPVDVADLAAALLELGGSARSGVHHVAGRHAVSRYELGVLIARRDGLDPAGLPGRARNDTDPVRPLEVRLDSTTTQSRLTTRLRGAREFLVPASAGRPTS